MHFFKKLFCKKNLKFVFCLLLIFVLAFLPNYIFNPQLYSYNYGEFFNLKQEKQTVLSIWHVETFEGGTASRKGFLQKVAINFNKSNKNCFFVIKQMSLEQFKLNLDNKERADIYSFGIGAGQFLTDQLEVLAETKNIRSDLLSYGKINDNNFAYPYILSGYVAITRQKYVSNSKGEVLLSKTVNKTTKVGFGFAYEENVNFSNALVANDFENVEESNYYSCSSFYEAYNAFVADKFCTLIGTARDLARCKNREQMGNLSDCEYNFLGGYSDLIQYIGINKDLEEYKKDIAKNFCEFLVSSKSQSLLKNYGLFTTNNQFIYDNGYMRDFEIVLHKELKSINVFSSSEQILKCKQESNKKLFATL